MRTVTEQSWLDPDERLHHLPVGKPDPQYVTQDVECGGAIVFPGEYSDVPREQVCTYCLAARKARKEADAAAV